MLTPWISTPQHLSAMQHKIDDYRKNYFNLSGGYQLPVIEYVGRFEKIQTENDLFDFFISIPIKNQEANIIKILESLLSNIHYLHNIGLLFDDCSDNSFQVCKQFFLKNFSDYPKLLNVYFIKSESDLFESTSENILSLFCEQKYFVSLQSDIYLIDKTFFSRCIDGFANMPHLMGISGRATVSFKKSIPILGYFGYTLRVFDRNLIFNFFNKYSKKLNTYFPFQKYYGDISNFPTSIMLFSKSDFYRIFLGEAIIRGPIVWKFEIFKSLKGYNDISYYLGRDDCDLSFRGLLRGYRVGYLPTQTFSFYEDGTTRKTKTSKVIEMINGRELLAKSNPGELTKFWTEKKRQQNKTVVIYFRLIRFLITQGRFVYLNSESTSNNFSKFLRLRTPQKSVSTLSQDVTM